MQEEMRRPRIGRLSKFGDYQPGGHGSPRQEQVAKIWPNAKKAEGAGGGAVIDSNQKSTKTKRAGTETGLHRIGWEGIGRPVTTQERPKESQNRQPEESLNLTRKRAVTRPELATRAVFKGEGMGSLPKTSLRRVLGGGKGGDRAQGRGSGSV